MPNTILVTGSNGLIGSEVVAFFTDIRHRRNFGQAMTYRYLDAPSAGNHVCSICNLAKMKAHYSQWNVSKDLQITPTEIHDGWLARV